MRNARERVAFDLEVGKDDRDPAELITAIVFGFYRRAEFSRLEFFRPDDRGDHA